MNLKTVITAYDLHPSASTSEEQMPVSVTMDADRLNITPVEVADDVDVTMTYESGAAKVEGVNASTTIDEDLILSGGVLNLSLLQEMQSIEFLTAFAGITIVEQGSIVTVTVDSALSGTSTNPVQNKVITSVLYGKVDKEEGKGLSTNDYTNEDKAALAKKQDALTDAQLANINADHSTYAHKIEVTTSDTTTYGHLYRNGDVLSASITSLSTSAPIHLAVGDKIELSSDTLCDVYIASSYSDSEAVTKVSSLMPGTVSYYTATADCVIFVSAIKTPSTLPSVTYTLTAYKDLKDIEEELKAKIDDAPQDGKEYVRKDGEWVEKTDGGSTLTDEEQAALDKLVDQQNPLTLTVSGNGGTRETGTSVTPTATLTVKRGSTDVTASATLTASSGTLTDNKFSDAAITVPKSYSFAATYNGKTATAILSYSFSNYRYRGEISSVPAGDAALLSAIQSVGKELNETTTLGATNLSMGKYYLFAVVGTHTFEIRENSTNGVVSTLKSGTITVPRINGTGSDTYSYIIVPSSDMAWTFKIA